MHEVTDLRTKVMLLSQEQAEMRETLGELRLSLSTLREQLTALKSQVDTLQAAHEQAVKGSVFGQEVSVTPEPMWDSVG